MTFLPGRDNFSQRKEKSGLCPDLISETIFSGPTIRLYDEVQLNQCSRNSLIALAPFPPGYGKSFPAYFRPDKPIGRAGFGPGARTKIRQRDRRCGQRICVLQPVRHKIRESSFESIAAAMTTTTDERWIFPLLLFFSSSSAKVPSYILFVFLLSCQGCMCVRGALSIMPPVP